MVNGRVVSAGNIMDSEGKHRVEILETNSSLN